MELQCLSNLLSDLNGVFASEPTTSTGLGELSPAAESMRKRGVASIEATSPNQPEDQTLLCQDQQTTQAWILRMQGPLSWHLEPGMGRMGHR